MQRERNEQLILRWIDQWRKRRMIAKLFGGWKTYSRDAGDVRRSEDFCQQFYQRGLIMRSLRHMKLYS